MSMAEVAHRAVEAGKRRIDRHRRFGDREPPATAALPELPGLKARIEAWTVADELLADWRALALRARAGKFSFLGKDWPDCPADRRWHLDPISGMPWPADRFCFDIGYRHTGRYGDVKYVWEINRLQYLQPIAALAAKLRDRELARFCIEQICSWIDNNPAYQGVSWSSGIEIALRAVSIVIVTSLVGEQASDAERRKILGALAAMGYWLRRYPSLFSSANNHRVAEGLGLLVIGGLSPALSGAEGWKREGWAILSEAAEVQMLPDGVGAEQTVTYTAVVLEMLLFGLQVARAVGLAVPEVYRERLVLGAEWLRWLTDAAGNQPRIGDDDDASVIGIDPDGESHTRSVMACIAAEAGRGDLVPPGLALDFRQGVMGIPPAPAPGPQGLRTFADGGYTVARWPSPAGDAMLAFDHGYLGYLSIAAHGHADALSLWLHVGDQPVLIDAGTYLYHAGGTWRSRFRGTAAHNTLTVEGADSSTISGPFNWSHKATARMISCEEDPARWTVEAEHDGYLKRFGAVHRRRVQVEHGHSISIEDTLIGSASRAVEVAFLFHPTLKLVPMDDAVAIMNGSLTLARFRHQGPLACVVGLPGEPAAGWYSRYFGAIEPAPRLALCGILSPGQINRCSLELANRDAT
jgi:hypothetical protein